MIDPAETRVGGPTSTSDFEDVRMILRNRGPEDRVLKSVSSSCTCITVEPIHDLTIPAQSERTVTFRVRLPESGSTVTEIRWHVDLDPKPLRCRVVAAGRRALPLVRSVDNANVTFLALSSPDVPSKTVTIHTREPRNSSPWITGLNCDLPEMRVVSKGERVQSHPNDDFIDRSYTFELQWTRLPSDAEFRGALTAITTDAQRVVVGSVTGNHVDQVRLSPSIVHLSATRRTDTVFIDAASLSWTVDSESVPDWLFVECTTGRRGPCLRLSIREDLVAAESLTATLALKSSDGRHGTLPVRLEPLTP